MNILFLTLSEITDVREHGVYKDLIREFAANGHHVYVVSPLTDNRQTHIVSEDNMEILRLKNVKNRGIIGRVQKGIATVMTGRTFRSGIKKKFSDVKFDLVLFATPPITLYHAVNYIKHRDRAFCYLMLKDIFPQNAVDLRLLRTDGAQASVYAYFKKLESKLYAASDKIGCMSEANIRYLLSQHPEIPASKAELLPNSLEICDQSVPEAERIRLRKKYGLPVDKTVLVYGGNMGKPQNIPFLIECLKKEADNPDTFYFIAGSGADYSLLNRYVQEYRPAHVKLVRRLPRQEYDKLLAACDIGLLFLDYRFTIPNFPSRVLTYMQARLPVIACTDNATDIGDVIENGGFGVQCRSDDPAHFSDAVGRILRSGRLSRMGDAGYAYAAEHYSVHRSYQIIMESVNEVSVH